MGYSSGFLKKRIVVKNRKAATKGKFGIDSVGPEYDDTVCLWASVDWQKGKDGLREGAMDSYGVVLVRTRWTSQINERSRIVYEEKTYQIIPETFHADRQENTVQFMAQVIINDKTPVPITDDNANENQQV